MGDGPLTKDLPMLRLALLFALAPLAACASSAPVTEQPSVAPSGLTQMPLTIRTAAGLRRFTVEVAGTPAQQATGLMFRRDMAADHGMIFPFPAPRMASFWMRDTYLPLDLIFIRADGTIDSIGDGVPLDETPVGSLGEVTSVLELNGGTAQRLGIAPGDRVESAALSAADPGA